MSQFIRRKGKAVDSELASLGDPEDADEDDIEADEEADDDGKKTTDELEDDGEECGKHDAIREFRREYALKEMNGILEKLKDYEHVNLIRADTVAVVAG